MNKYLRNTYGPPDQTLSSSSEVDVLMNNLSTGQAAIVSAQGVATNEYHDPYVHDYLGDVWILSVGGNCSCK